VRFTLKMTEGDETGKLKCVKSNNSQIEGRLQAVNYQCRMDE